MRKKGKWFEGNVFSIGFSNERMERAKIRYGSNVLKPTALETKKRKGKIYSRFYHKPIEPGEFWD